jgi:hypothetical protein
MHLDLGISRMQISQGTRRTTYDNRSAVETGGSEDSNPRRMMVEFAFTALRWCETAVFSASDICRLKQQWKCCVFWRRVNETRPVSQPITTKGANLSR